MAKKQKIKVEVEKPQIQEVVETPQVVEQPKAKVVEKPLPTKDAWEIKDRTYFLLSRQKPLSYMIKTSGIYYSTKKKVTKENLNILKIKERRL